MATARCASAMPPPIKSSTMFTAAWCSRPRLCSSTSACRAKATSRSILCWNSSGGQLSTSRSSPTPASGSFPAARASTPIRRPCAGQHATGFPALGAVSGLGRAQPRGDAPPTVCAKTFSGAAGTPIASPSLIVSTARTSMRASYSFISLASSKPPTRASFRPLICSVNFSVVAGTCCAIAPLTISASRRYPSQCARCGMWKPSPPSAGWRRPGKSLSRFLPAATMSASCRRTSTRQPGACGETSRRPIPWWVSFSRPCACPRPGRRRDAFLLEPSAGQTCGHRRRGDPAHHHHRHPAHDHHRRGLVAPRRRAQVSARLPLDRRPGNECHQRGRLTSYFEHLAEDEKLIALGLCDESGKLTNATKLLPKTLKCEDLPQGAGESFSTLRTDSGRYLVSVFPIIAGEKKGHVVLLHDLSFVDARAREAGLYLTLALIGVAVGLSLLGTAIVLGLLRGWRRSIKAQIEDFGLPSAIPRAEDSGFDLEIRSLLSELNSERRYAEGIKVEWSPATLIGLDLLLRHWQYKSIDLGHGTLRSVFGEGQGRF